MAGKLDAEAIPETDADDFEALRAALDDFFAGAASGDYLAIQAFIVPTVATNEALSAARVAVRDRLGLATTLGFGPRFLHSTGQLHKGGADNGVFFDDDCTHKRIRAGPTFCLFG